MLKIVLFIDAPLVAVPTDLSVGGSVVDMARRELSEYAAMKDASTKFKLQEFASSMGRNENTVVMEVVRITPNWEESVPGMEPSRQIVLMKDVRIVLKGKGFVIGTLGITNSATIPDAPPRYSRVSSAIDTAKNAARLQSQIMFQFAVQQQLQMMHPLPRPLQNVQAPQRYTHTEQKDPTPSRVKIIITMHPSS